MKKLYAFFFLMLFSPYLGKSTAPLAPTVTLSTEAVAPVNIFVNGSGLAYTLKVVSTEAFALNSISFKLGGTFVNSDISFCTLYRNSSPSQSGVTFLGNTSVGSGGAISYTLSSTNIPANTPVYFLLIIQTTTTAVPNHTFKVNGAEMPSPVTLGSTASVLTIVNNQTDIAGPITIVKPTLILTTESVPSANVVKVSGSQIVYILKITNDYAANIRSIKVKFSGTFLAGDINGLGFWLQSSMAPNAPSLYSSFLSATTLSNGNTYDPFVNWNISANSTHYLYISVNPSASAVAGRTVNVDGFVDPLLISNSSAPLTTINNQTNITGTLTIIDQDLTISTEATPAATISQSDLGTAYIFKLLSTTGARFSSINIPTQGTFNSTDIQSWNVIYTSSPSGTIGDVPLTTFTFSNGVLTNNIQTNRTLNANTPLYIILKPKFSINAVAGHTLKVNGALNPVTLNGFAGTPINIQTDAAGELTITAPTLTITSLPVAAATVAPLKTLIYSFKLNTNESYSLSNINLKIDGTFTAGQIQNLEIRQPGSFSFNIVGFALKGPGEIANFTLVGGTSLVANTDKIFEVYANFSPILPDNYTVKVNGVSNELTVASTTKTPTIVNNQTDIAGVKTVLAPMPTIYTSSSITDIGTQAKASYSSNEIITKVSSPSTISGNTNCQVWPTGAAAKGYVPRHYEINPPAASSTASASVTLYFTQPEFNGFNVDDFPEADVPTGPTDANGKANLRVYKFAGTSTAGSNGMTYASTTPTIINPDDDKIVWNALANRWEITFDITGFSGFFVGAVNNPLPVNLISFSGKNSENQIQLTWQTAHETNFSHFEIQKSGNGKEFGAIGKVESRNSGYYNFTDTNPTEGTNYYKLKMIDLDGTSSFSKTISINFEKNGHYLSVENPAKNGELLVRSNNLNPHFTLLNSLGHKMVISITELPDNQHKIKAKSINSGIYFLMVEGEGKYETRKIVFE